MNYLDLLRKKIDIIDSKIIKSLKERYVIAQKMAEYKQKHKLSLIQRNREKEILKNIKNCLKKNNESIEFIENIYKQILKESRKVQKTNINVYSIHKK